MATETAQRAPLVISGKPLSEIYTLTGDKEEISKIANLLSKVSPKPLYSTFLQSLENILTFISNTTTKVLGILSRITDTIKFIGYVEDVNLLKKSDFETEEKRAEISALYEDLCVLLEATKEQCKLYPEDEKLAAKQKLLE